MDALTRPLQDAFDKIEATRKPGGAKGKAAADIRAQIETIRTGLGEAKDEATQRLRAILDAMAAMSDQLAALSARAKDEIIVTRPQELFMTYLKVCAVCALLLAFPYVMYQAWGFVAAGLYRHERRYVSRYAPLSVGCFVVGVVFAYFAAVRVGVYFLLTFGQLDYISNKIALGQWIFFLVLICLMMGLVFELPIVMVFLSKIGIVTAAQYRANRKYAVLGIFILSAVLTPSPDPFSQILMAVPMMGLYELGIYLSRA